MIVYVAGPYTSAPEENTRTAIDAGHRVMDLGHTPYIPHLSHFMHAVRPREYEDWMRIDFDFVEKSDVLIRLPGASSGADREVERARACGIPICFGVDAFVEFLMYGSDPANYDGDPDKFWGGQ